jgi:murein DD-endopeptidase MepM/ murein hydrolase activator NlpD
MVALLLAASPALAETGGATGGSGSVPLSGDAGAPAPTTSAPGGTGGATGPSGPTAPASAKVPRGRPMLVIFDAAQATVPSASRAVVRFQVRDAASRVRVRLAFVSLAGNGTKRVNLGRRRTGKVHSIRRSLAAGSYRVRITAVNPRGKRAVRATTVEVAAPAPPAAGSAGVFPVKGPYDFGGAGSRFGAGRTGHIHQGQDIAAAEGTPLVAPKSSTVHWRAYQAGGAGYYLVLDVDGEDYLHVFMHLRQGSLLVSKGDQVAAGQPIAQVGNTGGSSGPHLHFEIWEGAWYNGGHPIDPLPILKSWEAAS